MMAARGFALLQGRARFAVWLLLLIPVIVSLRRMGLRRVAGARMVHPLSARLGGDDWLDGPFSAGDLMMVSVLLRLKPSGLLNDYSNLAAYVARGEARPAYQRAFAAQRAVFTGQPPAG